MEYVFYIQSTGELVININNKPFYLNSADLKTILSKFDY